jgi:arginase
MSPSAEYIVSPFALDAPAPAARAAAPERTRVNAARLDATSMKGRISQVHEPLADLVAGAVRRGARPVSVAGDCCATIGVMAGLRRGGLDPVVVWLDAHGDFNTWDTTPSGFMGGMPLAMLVGRGDQDLMRAVGLVSVPESDVILADARDLDPGERVALESSSVVRPGIARLMRAVPAGRPLYVHLDPDVISPADAPAMRYPATGGPRLAEVVRLCRSLAATGRVAAASLTLWDTGADRDGTTRRACLAALEALVS